MSKKNKVSDEDRALFREAVKKVKPVPKDKVRFEKEHKTPAHKRSALTESTSHNTAKSVSAAEAIQFSRSGVQTRMMRKLSQGQFPIDAQLDLHGHIVDQAFEELQDFLIASINQGAKCVLVIHGKGYRSGDNLPILKNEVNQWLRAWQEILAFCSAQPRDGGTGAVYVLLRS